MRSAQPDPYVDDFAGSGVPRPRRHSADGPRRGDAAGSVSGGPTGGGPMGGRPAGGSGRGPRRAAPARPAAAYGYDTGAWVAPHTAPSWKAAIRSDRVVLRPGLLLPTALLVAAALVWVVVVGYGLVSVDAPWSALAALGGAAALALAWRGFPVVGIVGLVVAVACWGFVSRGFLPESSGDVLGVARLVGGNLAFAVPLVTAFVAAVWTDGRRTAHAGIRAGSAQRWHGINRGESEPQLPALEDIPAARFFALPEGRCSHLVVAGRRVAVVGATVWPRGEYTVGGNEMLRNGRPFVPGTDDVDGAVDDLQTWRGRLSAARPLCRAFLVVHPSSERMGDTVRISVPELDGVQVLHADEFVELVGSFLAPEAANVNVEVMELLLDLFAEED